MLVDRNNHVSHYTIRQVLSHLWHVCIYIYSIYGLISFHVYFMASKPLLMKGYSRTNANLIGVVWVNVG